MIHASNLDVKKINKNRVFRYINRHERLSRPEIAAAMGMSGPTILKITGELLEKGIICEVGEFESTGGRKAKALAPIHNARYSVGMDITQNHLGFVLTNLSGEVLRHIRVQKVFTLTETYLSDMSVQLKDFINGLHIADEKILGVGISFPGIINPEKSEISYSHLLNIFNVPCESISKYIPYPCVFVNDANAAATAEINHLVDTKEFTVYISLSNSVGGAIISKQPSSLMMVANDKGLMPNHLYLGHTYKSGEIGHMTLIPNGNTCYCGHKGCFDVYCSAKVLTANTNGRLEAFFERLHSGDIKFSNVWEKYLNYLAIQINSLHMLMDCNIIVGGYVGSFIEPYIKDLRRRVEILNTFRESGDYLRACRYKVEASALGAALIHIEAYINTI